MLHTFTRLRATAYLAGVLAVTAATLAPLPASATPPAVPTGLAMTADPDSPATSILSWNHVPDANRYQVSVDDASTFSSPYESTFTVSNTFVSTKTLGPGTTYWRVTAFNAAGESSSATSTFEAPAGGSPVPVQPAEGDELQQPGEPPLLRWTPVPGATEYTVKVDGDSDLNGALTYKTKTTSLVVEAPLDKGNWFWQVTATLSGGVNSQPSVTRSFEILPIPAPQLLEPANAADPEAPLPDPVQDIRLDWAAVDGAKSYKLEVALNEDFTTMVSPAPPAVIYGTSFSPPVTWDNTSYYWRVRAVDPGGNESDWSERWLFRRNWPDKPVAQYPASGSGPLLEVTDPMYFQWSPVRHASEYELQLSTDEGFSDGEATKTCVISGTTYTPGIFAVNTTDRGLPQPFRPDEDCEPVPGATNYWRVRPLDRPFIKGARVPTGVWGFYSDPEKFKYLPPTITNMSPVGGATVDVPTLRWTATKSAETYTIEVAKANGTPAVPVVTTSATSYTISGREQLKPADGPFSWSIYSTSTDGIKSVRYTNTFNVSGNPPAATGTYLDPISPAPGDEATVDAPNLRWQPHPDAKYYRVRMGTAADTNQVWFGDEPGALWNKDVPYAAMTETSRRLLAPGDYDWQVFAYNEANVEIARGAEGRFSIKPYSEMSGFRLALNGGATNSPGSSCVPTEGVCVVPSTPVLRWDPTPRASFYMVYVSYDRDFTNLLEEPRAIPATTNTLFAPTLSNQTWAYPDSQAGDADSALYWFIRPCRGANNCALPPTGGARPYHHTFKKVSPKVELISPAAGSVQTSVDVTFNWRDYFDTNQDQVWEQTLEKGPQTAMLYRLQVSDSQNFGTLIEEVVVDQPTYTSPNLLYPEGTSWWRVQAIDSKSNHLAWSTPRSFTKTSPQATLTGPVGGAASSETAPLTWESQEFLGAYEVEVYKDNDDKWSALNRVVSKTVRTPAFANDKPLPPSALPYVWRVRRVDPKSPNSEQHKAPWSAPGRFTVAAEPFELLSPADGSVQAPSGPLLRWKRLSTASTYSVEVRNASNSIVASVDTVATAYAPTAALPTGAYTWKVTAKDAVGNVLASPSRGFTVDAAISATTPPQIQAPSGTAIGATLNVVDPVWNRAMVTNTYQWLRAGQIISGATGTSYTLVNLDYGKQITVRVTGKRSGYADGVTVSPGIDPVAGDGLIPETYPTITWPTMPSPPAVGASLTGTRGTWANAPTTYTYQWLRSGEAITGAVNLTYQLTAADADKAITFRVTATRSGYNSGVAESDPVMVATLAATTPVSLAAPAGTGVGATLASSAPVWNQDNVTTTYQWLRDGQNIPGATSPSYVLTTTDFGRGVSVRATGSKTGFQNATSVSAAITVTAGAAMTATALPTINGTPGVGTSVSASTGTWTGTPSSYRYQWLRDGQPIAGATTLSYRITPDDATRTLSVQVTAVRVSYTDGVATSAGVAVPKLKSTTNVFASPMQITRSQRSKLSISVSLVGATGPTGTIVIKDGSKKLKSLSLSASKNGRITFKLPKLKKVGKHKIKVSYSGNGYIAGSRAKRVIIKVTR
jgi:hypothetical protein